MVINFDIFYFGKQTVKQHMKVKVAQLCPTLCDPMDYTVHGILQVRIREWVAFPFFRGSSQPGIEPRSPPLQVYSLPAEPLGKPKNTGMGSLSLLQEIFPTQEMNEGLLHHRQILYQLSYEGSPHMYQCWYMCTNVVIHKHQKMETTRVHQWMNE